MSSGCKVAPGVSVTSEPKGWRDVYWCHFINEPGFLKWRGIVKCCGVCDQEITDVVPMHTFLFHIAGRPTREGEGD
jgi:hypothetical protein